MYKIVTLIFIELLFVKTMYSISILTAVLFAIFTITNAAQCRPVTCMIVCPFGFNVDAQGCPYCSCRKTPSNCFEPIYGYNCGIVDHRDCPSSHECHLSSNGYTGQCCLKLSSSTTATGTSTPRATTAVIGTSTRRGLNHFSALLKR